MPKSSCRVVMRCFRCRNTTRPLAERISLKLSDFDDVRLSHTVPTHSPPTLYAFIIYYYSAFLPLYCVCACLSYAVTQSLSEAPITPARLCLSACHSLPHMVLPVLAKLAHVSWRVCLRVIVVLADVRSHTCSYLQKMNRDSP